MRWQPASQPASQMRQAETVRHSLHALSLDRQREGEAASGNSARHTGALEESMQARQGNARPTHAQVCILPHKCTKCPTHAHPSELSLSNHAPSSSIPGNCEDCCSCCGFCSPSTS